MLRKSTTQTVKEDFEKVTSNSSELGDYKFITKSMLCCGV